MIDNDDTPIAESRNPVFFLRAADGRCASARQPAGAYVLASDCASYFEAAKAEVDVNARSHGVPSWCPTIPTPPGARGETHDQRNST